MLFRLAALSKQSLLGTLSLTSRKFISTRVLTHVTPCLDCSRRRVELASIPPTTNYRVHHLSTMSSSEEENFEIDDVSGSESDDFAPVKKKAVRTLLLSILDHAELWLD